MNLEKAFQKFYESLTLKSIDLLSFGNYFYSTTCYKWLWL